MNRKAPKYFHYFLACLAFDSLLIIPIISINFSITQILFAIGIWFVANFLNYPRIISRRYISYYLLLRSTLRQLATFFGLYLICFLAFFEDFIIKDIIDLWPFALVFINRLIFVYVLRAYRKRGKGYNRFVMIGDTPFMNDLKERFLANKAHGYVHEATLNSAQLDKIKDFILDRNINEIYCSSSEVSQEDISKLLGHSLKFGVNVMVISDNGKQDQVENDIIPLEMADLDLIKYPLMDQKNLIIKRAFDVLFSLFVILGFLSWIIPLISIIILIDSRGTIFFNQPRAGRNGKYFMCLKFRSMKANSGVAQAVRNDPRVTKFGRILRKYSLDELPQFFNVLIGQMSVVGPRPHIKDLNDMFDSEIDSYNDRILVKPGITGLSQISGHRGETKQKETMEKRIQTDISYLKNWRLSLDIVIIYKTLFELFSFKKNDAY